MIETTLPETSQEVSDELREVCAAGEAALRTFWQSLDCVFKIGRAFSMLQQEAMRRSHSNNPIGKRYNEAWAALAAQSPGLAKLNKTDCAQFMWCWEHREQIQAWWDNLGRIHVLTPKTSDPRDRWYHPDAIKKQYLKAHGQDFTLADTADDIARVWFESADRAKLLAATRALIKLDDEAKKAGGAAI